MTEAAGRKKKVSYLEYLSLPDDGKRYEVIDGEVYMTPAPTTGHQDVLGRLWDIVFHFVSDQKIGRVFFAPVDVVSPTTALRDRVEKRVLYERYGVKEYWVVDPEAKQVEVWVLERGEYLGPKVYGFEDGVPVRTIPGLAIPLKQVFG